MPNRWVCVAILLFWTIAAGTLFTRDVLPNYLLGPPPDLRTISQADEPSGPTRWSILASDEGKPNTMRSVGQITTETKRKRDGWVRMTSNAWLDSGELMRGLVFDNTQGDRIGILGACEIDVSGNLQNFRIGVRLDDRGGPEVLSLEGRLKKDTMEVTTRGFLNTTQIIPYQPRAIVQSALSPLDRMPGLQVGQTWETSVVSPITGAIQSCRVKVEKTEHIIWGGKPVLTLKVVTKMMPISAATWVRPDGLVIRQEIPFSPRVRLLMERLPNEPTKADSPATNSEGRRR